MMKQINLVWLAIFSLLVLAALIFAGNYISVKVTNIPHRRLKANVELRQFTLPALEKEAQVPSQVPMTKEESSESSVIESNVATKDSGNIHNNSNTPAASRKIAIFYNVYAGPGRVRQALTIVREQLDAWKSSGVADAHLYYLSLGEEIDFPCPPDQKCTSLGHMSSGNEVSTLQHLRNHCVEHPREYVIYMHDKGSYHFDFVNTLRRRELTRAIFSEECTTMPEDTCNVCSSRFSPQPHWHTPGNMWFAHCAYIKNLIDPTDFNREVSDVVTQAKKEWGLDGAHPPPWFVGMGRYAAEHWVYTHPDVKPCDVDQDYSMWGGVVHGEQKRPFSLVVGPRFTPRSYDKRDGNYKQNERWRTLEYRLMELQKLYGTKPGKDSWVWPFYEKQARGRH